MGLVDWFGEFGGVGDEFGVGVYVAFSFFLWGRGRRVHFECVVFVHDLFFLSPSFPNGQQNERKNVLNLSRPFVDVYIPADGGVLMSMLDAIPRFRSILGGRKEKNRRRKRRKRIAE